MHAALPLTRRPLLVGALGALLLAATAPVASARADRNHDRIPDRWEARHGLSLSVNQARRDQDHDGLRNRDEFLARTDPRDADTDGDGVGDGEEGAGRITAFSGGRLTVALFGGEIVSARVDARTTVSCRGAAALERESRRRHRGGRGARIARDGDSGVDGEAVDDLATAGEDAADPTDDEAAPDAGDDTADAGEDAGDDVPLDDGATATKELGDTAGDEGKDRHDAAHRCGRRKLAVGRTLHEGELRVTAAGLAWRDLEVVG